MPKFKVGDKVRYAEFSKESGKWQNVELTRWNEKFKQWTGIDPKNGEGEFSENELELLSESASALDIQVGGDHYKTMPIQPMTFSMANGLDACQHTIIKYVTRFRDKGGIEDLEKAKHCIDLLIGFEREKENDTV